MANSARVAVSQILRNKDETVEDEDEPKKKSREDWRKAKELEEARKAGTAPAAVDETSTKMYIIHCYMNRVCLNYNA